MAPVTFQLGFKTSELRGIDLPIEVRKYDSTIVCKTLASKPVEVRPGQYYASALLPGGQRLLQAFEMSAQPLTVTLVPDPDDESPHEWEEASHYLQPPKSLSSASREGRAQDPQVRTRSARLESDVSAGPAVKARFRLFSGNPLTGSINLEPAMSHLTVGPFERGRIVQFIVTCNEKPLIAQLVEPGMPVHNMTIPVVPFGQAELVFTRRDDGTCRMDVHLRNKTADMLLRYCDTASLSNAQEGSQSTLLDAEQLLAEKGADPIAAAVAACSILRFGQLKWLHDWTANLDGRFEWLPDGAAIHGEHLARLGKHPEAAQRLFEVSARGLPVIGDALFYAAERLKWYASLKSEHAQGIDLNRAKQEAEKLRSFAVAVHRQRPLTSYSGIDPARPTVETAPAGAMMVTESIELAQWLGDGGVAEALGGSAAPNALISGA